MHRRRFLATTRTLALAGLAGCTGGGSETKTDAETTQATTTDTASSDSGGPSIDQHPAAAGLDAQPVRGELGGNVIIAFEDPSCPRCRAFETGTVPRIESDLVETGQSAYVYRRGRPSASGSFGRSSIFRDDERPTVSRTTCPRGEGRR